MKKNSSKNFKIRVVTIIAFLVVISILYFSVAALASSGFFVIEHTKEEPEYYFYEADFAYDIFKDEEYLELISYGFMTYDDGTRRTSLSEDDYEFCSDPVKLVIELVLAAQSGDADAYNACFSSTYMNKEGKQRDFTMQQIYDIVITEEYTLKEGKHLRTDIKLEYKIHKNNGTLRDDVESDLVKEQYLTLTTNNTEKVFLIDSMNTKEYIGNDQFQNTEYNIGNLIAVGCACIALTVASLIAVVIVFKKTKNIRCGE